MMPAGPCAGLKGELETAALSLGLWLLWDVFRGWSRTWRGGAPAPHAEVRLQELMGSVRDLVRGAAAVELPVLVLWVQGAMVVSRRWGGPSRVGLESPQASLPLPFPWGCLL